MTPQLKPLRKLQGQPLLNLSTTCLRETLYIFCDLEGQGFQNPSSTYWEGCALQRLSKTIFSCGFPYPSGLSKTLDSYIGQLKGILRDRLETTGTTILATQDAQESKTANLLHNQNISQHCLNFFPDSSRRFEVGMGLVLLI